MYKATITVSEWTLLVVEHYSIQYTKQNFISLKSHKVNTWVYMYNATYNNWWQGLIGEGGRGNRVTFRSITL